MATLAARVQSPPASQPPSGTSALAALVAPHLRAVEAMFARELASDLPNVNELVTPRGQVPRQDASAHAGPAVGPGGLRCDRLGNGESRIRNRK